MYIIRRLAGHVYVLLSYLPTILEFPGQSWKLTSQLAVPEVFKIVPGITHMASAYTKYKLDCDRMLMGQDQC